MKILTIVFAGYEELGIIEIGPISTFYSFNPVEGSRIRIGGRTTPKFNPHLRFESYAAYGFGDEKWKYYFGITKALGKKSFIDFPQKNLLISYQLETKIPGQELQFVQEDNALLSIKRGENDKLLYNKTFSASYKSEFDNHFSFDLGIQHLIQSPAGSLYFNKVGYNDVANNISEVTNTVLNLGIRLAPHEQFYQGKNYRIPMFNQFPIIEVRLSAAEKDLLKSEYTYKNLSASIFKRINIAPFGFFSSATLCG